VAKEKGLAAIILAAGKGTRMKSGLVKVLHTLMGMPMLCFIVDVVKRIDFNKIVVVVGFQEEVVRKRFEDKDLIFVEQREQLGTGHAVLCAEETLKGFDGDVLIICGDVPLIKDDTVRALVEFHQESNSRVTVLTTKLEDPTGYGRIARGDSGDIIGIVEDKDASDAEKKLEEVNTGIYCVEAVYLFDLLRKVGRDNKQSEYYLTDVVAIAAERGDKVLSLLREDPLEVLGINNRIEMARASEVIRKEILDKLMINGVSIIDPKTTFIERDVEIGRDTVIYPNCHIRGRSTVGKDCVIDSGCVISDSEIGDCVQIKPFCVINDSRIASKGSVGPFSHLRPGSESGPKVKIGN